jgi:hypothetical protein
MHRRRPAEGVRAHEREARHGSPPRPWSGLALDGALGCAWAESGSAARSGLVEHAPAHAQLGCPTKGPRCLPGSANSNLALGCTEVGVKPRKSGAPATVPSDAEPTGAALATGNDIEPTGAASATANDIDPIGAAHAAQTSLAVTVAKGVVILTMAMPQEALAQILAAIAPRAEAVNQDTALAVFGIGRRRFLELARSGAFPVRKDGDLRIAWCVDVRRYLNDAPEGQAVSRRTPEPQLDEVARDLLAMGRQVGPR